ncbi:MAG: response regulator [Planctomycetes bacterium]|nr:response regulator [Planctomycetota bacterium]
MFALCISFIPIATVTTLYYFYARSVLTQQIQDDMKAAIGARAQCLLSSVKTLKAQTLESSSGGFTRKTLENLTRGADLPKNTAVELNRCFTANTAALTNHPIATLLVDKCGKIVWSSNERVVGQDVPDRTAFLRTLDNRRGEITLNQSGDFPGLDASCISVTAPVFSLQDTIPVGGVVNAYNPAILGEGITSPLGIGEMAAIYLTDGHKAITIYRMGVDVAKGISSKEVSNVLPASSTVAVNKETIDFSASHKTGPIVRVSADIPECGWILSAEIEKAKTFSSLKALGFVALIFGIAGMLVTSGAGIMFVISTYKPIQGLTDAAARLVDGDLAYRLTSGRNDEVGILANSLNLMSERLSGKIAEYKRAENELQRLNESLENRVAERTTAVTKANEELQSEISEHKAALLKLREAEKEIFNQKKFLDALIQNTNVYVITISAQGNILFVNRAIESKFGYAPQRILERPIIDVFIPPNKKEELVNDIKNLLDGACGKQIAIPFMSRDYQVRDILWDVTYFKDDSSVITSINLLGLDVTEQNLLKEQLIHADKLSSLGTMVSGVAHELNNPLSVIMNYSELLMAYEGIPKKASDRLYRIIEASQRCARIVDNLIKFATKRKSARNMQHLCINDILRESLELKANNLRIDNIEVVQTLSPSLPFTMADRVSLMQVFINIINNAHDAMKVAHGKGTLLLRTFPRGGKIIIEIEDNGPGIQAPEKLFTPFYTTKEVGKGTGLGLAVSYGIIKEHGGTITGSTSKRGALFAITLPIRTQTIQETKPLVAGESRDLKGLCLLIIEDDVNIAESCCEFLTGKGCHVKAVYNTTDARDTIQKESFDIVIMDLKMPGEMTGMQLYEWMTTYHPVLKSRVILTTGDVLSPESKEFIEKYSVNVVPKPFHFDDLMNSIYHTKQMFA